jgi:hypothetical protein
MCGVWRVACVSSSKYNMRIHEITEQNTSPKLPLTPEQSRIQALKLSVKRSQQQLGRERAQQQQQRSQQQQRKLAK